MSKIRGYLSSLRENFTLTRQVHAAITDSQEKVNESIGPYRRFVQVQQEQLGEGYGEEQEDDLDEGLVQQLNEADPSGHLYALVRNKVKQSKGVGKGGKGKSNFGDKG